jgi:hypothetical protein
MGNEMHIGLWWGKPDGNGPLGRPRHRLHNNIKIGLEEVGWEAWIGLL